MKVRLVALLFFLGVLVSMYQESPNVAGASPMHGLGQPSSMTTANAQLELDTARTMVDMRAGLPSTSFLTTGLKWADTIEYGVELTRNSGKAMAKMARLFRPGISNTTSK